MKQYKSEKTLDNAVEKWLKDVIINKFHFKGDFNNPEEVKQFLKIKKLHTFSNTNPKYNTKTIVVYRINNSKVRYECDIDYVNLTLNVR